MKIDGLQLDSVEVDEVTTPEGVRKALKLAEQVVENSDDEGDVNEISVEVARAVIKKLKVMLDNASNEDGVGLTMADLKDMTAMLKDLTAFLTKVGGSSEGSGKGLEAWLERRKL